MQELTFFQMLGYGNAADALGMGPFFMWKAAGLTGLIFTALVAGSWATLLLGLAMRRSRILVVTIALGLMAMAVGWGGSYLGYSQAMEVIRTSAADPRASELAQAANHMWWCGLVPTLAFGVTMVGALLCSAIATRSDDRGPRP